MLAAVLGAGVVLLDGTVVNVALPALGRDLDASLSGLQWTINAYALTLSGLILLGGALGDRFGQRRIYLAGTVWFAAASLLCGVALTLEWLVAARAVQGIGGALLVPGSLALIQTCFHPDDRARAVGVWSGLTGVIGGLGPLLGGWLVDLASWRWVFLVNVPLAAVVALVLLRQVPDRREATAPGRFDALGAVLAALGLAGVTYALTQASAGGGWQVAMSALVGLAILGAFLLVEARGDAPMLPLELFASRRFSTANLVSFCAYGAVAGLFFLLPIQLQITTGYSALGAGLALLPATALQLALSAHAAALTARIGPRIPLSVGSLVSAAALLLAIRIGPHTPYLTGVLPTVGLAGIGISLITPPITVTVLDAVPGQRVGIASGVNNGVARAAGLLVVAALPLVAGLPQNLSQDPAAFDEGFGVGMLVCAGLFLLGGLLAWFGVGRAAAPRTQPACQRHGAVHHPPLEPSRPY
jgi:EmrB/QacA subfamily drug resistance transporter